MRRRQITFLLAGLIAGLICVAPGSSWVVLLTLTYGVGPSFFAAVLAGILVTGAWRHLKADFLRYLAGLVLCAITYFLALLVFLAIDGYSPDLLGFRPSGNVENFGLDVWLGLIAAGAVGASGIALFTAMLTGQCSKSLFLRLLLAGLITIVITYMVNLPFHSYWSFLGVLLPIGSALFCWLVGTQIWLHHEAASSALATQAA